MLCCSLLTTYFSYHFFFLQCTTGLVKGPIAVLDPSVGPFLARLKIYETLHNKYDVRPVLVHHGVSILLLDYLVITALLLVTDVRDWTVLTNVNITSQDLQNTEHTTPPKSAPGKMSTSDPQWRKIMYGEPLFPKQTRSSYSASGSSENISPISPTPLTRPYGQPYNSTPGPLDVSAEEDDQLLYFSATRTRPTSPSAESVFDPRSAGSAPSHNYLDPSFYNGKDVPPVPPIPAQFRNRMASGSTSRASGSGSGSTGSGSGSRSSHIFSFSSRPSSSHSTTSSYWQREVRELPVPPPIPPLIPRPRSTPPRPMTSPTTGEEVAMAETSQPSSGSLPPPIIHRATSDHSSISTVVPTPRRPSRQLPRLPIPPPVPENSNKDIVNPHADAGHTPSRSRSFSLHQQDKWHPRRTLPSPPTGSSRQQQQEHVEVTDQGPCHRIFKEAEDDMTWVHALTSPREHVPLPMPLAGGGTRFDVPPPAYNSINFSATMSIPLPPTPPPPVSTSGEAHACLF